MSLVGCLQKFRPLVLFFLQSREKCYWRYALYRLPSPKVRKQTFYLIDQSKTNLKLNCSLPKTDILYMPCGTEHRSWFLVPGSGTVLDSWFLYSSWFLYHSRFLVLVPFLVLASGTILGTVLVPICTNLTYLN